MFNVEIVGRADDSGVDPLIPEGLLVGPEAGVPPEPRPIRLGFFGRAAGEEQPGSVFQTAESRRVSGGDPSASHNANTEG